MYTKILKKPKDDILGKGNSTPSTPKVREFSQYPMLKSAFNYMKNHSTIMHAEHTTFLNNPRNMDFAIAVDRITMNHSKNTKDLASIRTSYTSPELKAELEAVVKEHAPKTELPAPILHMYARNFMKWEFRDRMKELGFQKDLDAIHAVNEKKYKDPIGPKPSELIAKYPDMQQLLDACSRFRDKSILKQQLAEIKKQDEPEVTQEQTKP